MSPGWTRSASPGKIEVPAPERAPRWAPPLLALQFLTRLPVPILARLTAAQAEDGMARAMGWLPLVGSGVGLVTAGTFAAAGHFWPPLVAALLALAVEAVLTGFFHEDAVADFCDAFGGTARGENALRIMRDSRIGSYGTVGLTLAIGLRVTTMSALPLAIATLAIIAAATMGRLWAVLLSALAPPPGESGIAARTRSGTPGRRVICAVMVALPGIVPLALTAPLPVFGSVVVGAVFLSWARRFVIGRIGGATGDCLGFAAYMGQLALLLCATAR